MCEGVGGAQLSLSVFLCENIRRARFFFFFDISVQSVPSSVCLSLAPCANLHFRFTDSPSTIKKTKNTHARNNQVVPSILMWSITLLSNGAKKRPFRLTGMAPE